MFRFYLLSCCLPSDNFKIKNNAVLCIDRYGSNG